MHGFIFINKRLLISCDTGIYAIIANNSYLHLPRFRRKSEWLLQISMCVRKPTIWVPSRSDTLNRPVQSQIEISDFRRRRIYYPCSENKGADQLFSPMQIVGFPMRRLKQFNVSENLVQKTKRISFKLDMS